MKTLIHKFYDSVKNNSETPVAKEEALRVIKISDEIIKQLSTITARLNESTYLAENAVQDILKDLKRSADNIKSFTEALKDRPSQTLFGEPLEKPEQ